MAVYEHLVPVVGSGQAQTAHVLDGATDDSRRLRYTPCSLAAEEMIRRDSDVAGK